MTLLLTFIGFIFGAQAANEFSCTVKKPTLEIVHEDVDAQDLELTVHLFEQDGKLMLDSPNSEGGPEPILARHEFDIPESANILQCEEEACFMEKAVQLMELPKDHSHIILGAYSVYAIAEDFLSEEQDLSDVFRLNQLPMDRKLVDKIVFYQTGEFTAAFGEGIFELYTEGTLMGRILYASPFYTGHCE